MLSTKTTIIKVVKKIFLNTWLDISQTKVKRYIRALDTTILGYFNRQRKSKMNTKDKINNNNIENKDNTMKYLILETKINNTHIIFENLESRIYLDQTRNSSKNSRLGGIYIIILHAQNCNIILAQAIDSKIEEDLIEVHNHFLKLLTKKASNLNFAEFILSYPK